ncbi:hypothetical protein Hanom_Chr10g00934911 [Helianthus anomalus]
MMVMAELEAAIQWQRRTDGRQAFPTMMIMSMMVISVVEEDEQDGCRFKGGDDLQIEREKRERERETRFFLNDHFAPEQNDKIAGGFFFRKLTWFDFWTKMTTKMKPQGPRCKKFQI